MSLIRTLNLMIILAVVFAFSVGGAFVYVALSFPNPEMDSLEVHFNESGEEMIKADAHITNSAGEGQATVELKAVDEYGEVLNSWQRIVEMNQDYGETVRFEVEDIEEADNYEVSVWARNKPEIMVSESEVDNVIERD